MDKPHLQPRGGPPNDYDWPVTIVMYVLMTLLGVGMCFCLRKANQLIPNRLSFPLVSTQPQDRRRGYDASDIEQGDNDAHQGLLSEYDQDNEDDGYPRPPLRESVDDSTSFDEEFGELQAAEDEWHKNNEPRVT